MIPPIPVPDLLKLLLMLTSIFPSWGVGAEVGPIAPDWVPEEGQELCGIYERELNRIWVNTDTAYWYCSSNYDDSKVPQKYQILAHEVGHAVADECMSSADRGHVRVTYMEDMENIPWGFGGAYSPSEQFADAFGQIMTGWQYGHNGPQPYRLQAAALSYFARCNFEYEFYSVHYAYQVFNQVYAPQITKETHVSRIMRGWYTPEQFATNHVWKTNTVRNLSDTEFVYHLFRQVHNRLPILGAEETAWIDYASTHTQEQTFDIMMRVSFPRSYYN